MDSAQLVEFVRQRGLAVAATRDADGEPQAALVGVAATAEGEIVFTLTLSRKYRNITSHPRVALVIGWDDEITLQCEGLADLPHGEDLVRCTTAYFEQYPDGRQRAANPDIRHVRVRPGWCATATTARLLHHRRVRASLTWCRHVIATPVHLSRRRRCA